MNNLLNSQTLRHSLAEWTEIDAAAYYVAIALGIAPDPGSQWDYWGGKKWMFWSVNPLGDSLFQILDMLTENGVLEKNEDLFYRWNPKFEWEKHGEEPPAYANHNNSPTP